MDFFNKLGKKVSETYDATAEKTSKLAKEAKLRMKMNENKSNINDLYKEIGKKVYEKHLREENIDIKSELAEECSKIDALSAEIESALKEILELKDKKQCIKCASEIELSATFCPKCGEKQPEEEVKVVEVVDSDVEVVNENQENNEGTAEETTPTEEHEAKETVENETENN